MVGTCPETMLDVGGVNRRCFINTGTKVWTVTETSYQQDLDKLELMNVGELIHITAVNGLDIPYVGYVTLIDLRFLANK